MYCLTAALVAASASLAIAAPTYPAADACTPSSTRTSEFHVKDFDFHASYTFSTPAHQNSWGYVNFTLANAALPGSDLVCSSASSWLSDFYYGNINYECVPAPATAAGQEELLAASQGTFNFARPTNELAINQTWACADQGSRFWAEGRAKLDLECRERNWQNSNWTIGQIYSERLVTCNKLSQPVPFTSMRSIM